MKTLIRMLSILLLTLLLVSCSDQEEISAPDSANPAKPAGAPSSLSITSISPAAAEIGDVITITGTNFGGTKQFTSSVTIKGITATVYVSWTNTSISVLVPSGAAPGAGSVVVKLKTKSSNAVNFTLLPSSPVTIGSQVWMGANLDVSTYRDNTSIPQVMDATAWDNLTTGAWCYPNNDPILGTIYGKLYNWYAVHDGPGLAPTGWHVATDAEWKTLSIYLGMSPQDAELPDLTVTDRGYYGTDQGGKLKEAGTSLWLYPNLGATNSSGFTALPGGMRSAMPAYDFSAPGSAGVWWTDTEADPNLKADAAWTRLVDRSLTTVYRGALSKKHGFSVRCVQDN